MNPRPRHRHLPFLLFVLAVLLHGVGPAPAPGVQHADPVTLVVASVVLVAGSIFYSRQQAAQMAKKAKRDRDKNAGTLITSREPAAQRRILYGRRRLGGIYTFIHSTDSPGGLKNEYLHLIIALTGHEVNAIGDLYFDDNVVPLDGSGNCVSGPYAGLVRVKKYLGTADQTANAELIAEAPDKWTSAHRLRGISYVYVRLKYDQNKLANIPNVTAVLEGKKLYDPRTGLTTYSANPALAIRDYLTDTDYGLGVAADELNEASFIAAAALCDEAVALAGGGTEPRYTCHGVIERDSTPADVLRDLSASMSAAVICSGGTWSIVGGAYSPPSQTLTFDDLRGQIQIQTKDSRRDTCNAIKGTFISEANKWQPADYPPVKNAYYYTQDGERIWRELSLPFTTSAATAQRLAKIELEQARQEITLQLPIKLVGLRLQPGETVLLTMARYGWAAKPFEVIGWKLVIEDGVGEGGGKIVGVDLSVRETAAGVWDWNDGLETTVDLAPNTNLPDPRAVAAPTSLVVISAPQQNADGSTSGMLLVTWVASADAFARGTGGRVEVQFRNATQSDWIAAASVSGATERTVIGGVATGVSYLVRIRAVNPSGVASDWVQAVSAVTASGDTTAPGTPYFAAVWGIYQGMRITWRNPSDPDLSYVEIYEAASAGAAPTGGSTGLARVAGTDYVRSGLGDNQTRHYWIRAVDVSGNGSGWVYAGAGTTAYVSKTSIPDWTQVDDIEGGLTQEIIDRANAVNALNSSLTGSINSVDARVTTEVTNRTNALTGEANARSTQITQAISNLNSSLSGPITAAVAAASTAQTGVDSIKAEYVLNVVTNGGGARRVAGFRVTNHGGAGGGTDFVIQADKFAIVNAGGDAQVAPFQVESGIVYMATAMIRDATIGTLKIAGNAITHPFVAAQSGSFYLNNTNFSDIISVGGVSANGSAVCISVSVRLVNNTGSGRDFILETLRDGSVIDSVVHRVAAGYDAVVTRMSLDTGAGGTHTYTSRVRITSTPGTANTVQVVSGIIQPSIFKR